ncbi:KAP P-loop domain protein [Parafrankia sp. EUN1f]|uniref:KAP P-loop domain protein n=1 Tax=Parafrankia sp. EUN1f TaxID=102897 RepID=UPI0001C43D43|nr:KAP P-loop domain protein [Parafrankia sp. EUN1f]EFC86649.1 KAP P-loop domain protein [Parafrankia sp. EUN1f]
MESEVGLTGREVPVTRQGPDDAASGFGPEFPLTIPESSRRPERARPELRTRYSDDSHRPAPAGDSPADRDLLGIDGDVAMLAKLVAARKPDPPLAIALLGPWGSGKSTFMVQMRKRVERLVQDAAKDPDPTSTAFVGRVLQVDFNAWHYSDDQVWTGLVDRLFRELAAAHDDSRQPSPSAAQARAQRDRLRSELARELRRQHRLTGSFEKIDDVAGGQGRFQDATAPTSIFVAMWSWARDLAADLWASRSVLLRIVVFVAVAGLAWRYGIRLAAWTAGQAQGGKDSPTLVRLVPWSVIVISVVYPGWKIYLGGRSLYNRLRRGLEGTLADVQWRIHELDRQLIVADAAAGLASFLAERSSEATYAGYRGLVGRVRDDLDQLATKLAEARQTWAEDEKARLAPVPAPASSAQWRVKAKLWWGQRRARRAVEARARMLKILPERRPLERIVLYIDDLDRCPPNVVADMLAAVHLLLALPLFVVVVAVDPAWLSRAVHQHRGRLFGNQPGEEFWTTADYLEKIFQIPFMLPEMGSRGRDYLRELLLAARTDADPDADPDAGRDAVQGSADTRPPDTGDVLRLLPFEEEFLPELFPLLPTPRACKRLLNLYRLIRIGIRPEHRADFLGYAETAGAETAGAAPSTPDDPRWRHTGGEYQVVAVLLAVLIRKADEAQQLFDLLVRIDGEDSDISRVLRQQAPNVKTGNMNTPGAWNEVEELRIEVAGLVRDLSARYGGRDAVMRGTDVYQRWVADVRRLSFPAAEPWQSGATPGD